MLSSLALFVAALGLRAVTANRHVRGRLLASMYAFGADVVLKAVLEYVRMPEGLAQPLSLFGPLLVAFGSINGLVALVLNPWRKDRVPERFPTIGQDTIVLVVFTVAATIILKERIFAATAAAAIALGFALQNTLGNLFAGLAIRIEKPFEVGHWVRIGDTDGQVSEITWRATKMRTLAGNFMVVPNNALAEGTIINYSEPSLEMRVEVDVGVSYDAPPNRVKSVILGAIRDEPLISQAIPPEILIVNFADSSVVYRARVWTTEFLATDERLQDRMRSAIYYAFRRNGVTIPYPISVEVQKEDTPPPVPDPTLAEDALRQVSIFSALTDAERAELARTARWDVYGAGELVVRQHERGSSMYVVSRGEVVVTVEPGDREVAVIGGGGFFGEMSLLTGEPRTATVRARSDAALLEITADAFRRMVLADPDTVEQVAAAVAKRRAELAAHAAAGAAISAPEPAQRLISRIRRFLRLAES
jgi:small-conductance mechanosensitive channel/CRP-like cAMP-binding protein